MATEVRKTVESYSVSWHIHGDEHQEPQEMSTSFSVNRYGRELALALATDHVTSLREKGNIDRWEIAAVYYTEDILDSSEKPVLGCTDCE